MKNLLKIIITLLAINLTLNADVRYQPINIETVLVQLDSVHVQTGAVKVDRGVSGSKPLSTPKTITMGEAKKKILNDLALYLLNEESARFVRKASRYIKDLSHNSVMLEMRWDF